jgi:hypothetical protein
MSLETLLFHFSPYFSPEKVSNKMKKSVCVLMAAMLTLTTLAFVPAVTRADDEMQVQQTWVHVAGKVEKFGSQIAYGWLSAIAKMKTINATSTEWAHVHVFWTTSLVTPIELGEHCREGLENFTFSFYFARLVSASTIALNYSGYDFYIGGLWDAYNVTFKYYPNEEGEFDGENFNITIVPLAVNATGEFRVTNNWTLFELSISGVDLVSGSVHHYFVGSMEIEIGDFTGDGKVNIHDLVHVAHAYGCRPGFKGFDFDMDLNCDFKIDVGDLATVAANIKA